MLRVMISSAEAGMKLAMPVFHPSSPGRVLLHAGFELDARTISRLNELSVRSVWVAYPKLSFLLKYASPEVIRHRAAIAGQVQELFDALGRDADAELEYSRYAAAVSSLIESLINNPESTILIDEIGCDQSALHHACSVCFLTTLMGLKLASYLEHQRSRVSAASARDVTPLGVAAMLHDIGMVRLPEEVRERFAETNDESDPAWREHVKIGFSMVHGKVPPAASAAVLHHHQRYDGSGFPLRRRADGGTDRFAGDQIHIYARIIAAADLFDRLSRRVDAKGNPVPRVRVLSAMRRDPIVRWIDPMVFKSLLAVCPPYAPGTQVTLSDGRECVVVGWEPLDPCRPRVIEFDPQASDDEPTGEVIDLTCTAGLCVARAEGVDVGRDNFYPIQPADFCLDTASRMLHNAAENHRLMAGAVSPPGARRSA